MFIVTDNSHNLQVHLNATDQKELPVVTFGNVRVTLSSDKAKELEDRLEETLKGVK